MASVVDICNTALAHLGSDNSISSIDPPDGSTEAGYCKRFYPLARKELIENGPWPFATKRGSLAEVINPSEVWPFAYALPADCLRPLRVLTQGPYGTTVFTQDAPTQTLTGESASAPFEIEDGVIYTAEASATLVYRRDVTDTTKFTPTFTSALGYLLASYLSGPIVRGKDGAATAQNLRQLALQLTLNAATHAAQSSHEVHNPIPQQLAVR